jgi:ribonuclease H / adenosylcobalamin/alpha-ribazole phosphatase
MSTDLPTRVVFVRHGETTYNAQQRFRGLADPPLDQVGEDQAAKVARAIGRFSPTTVYCSPLERARSTAQAIATTIGIQPMEAEELRDIDYGRWTGKTRHGAAVESPAAFALWMHAPQHLQLPGGERVAGALARVWDFVIAAARKHAGETIVMVTHDMPIRLMVCRLLDSPLESLHRVHVDLVSTTGFLLTATEASIVWLNDTNHLRETSP